MKSIRDFFANLFGRKEPQKNNNAKGVAKHHPIKGQKGPKRANVAPKGHKIPPKITQKAAPKQPEKTDTQPQKDSTNKVSISDAPKRQSSGVSISDARISPQNGKPPNRQIFDVCAYVIVCGKHNKIALSKDQRSDFVWLPFISITNSKTWTDGCLGGVNIILSNGDANTYLKLNECQVLESVAQCMQIFRLQLPQTQKFNTRLIYCAKLNEHNTCFKCCTDTQTINWYDINDIINGKVKNIWGPEVKEYTKLSSEPIIQRIEEYSLDLAFFYVPRDPPRNLEEELLRSTNYTEKDVERIYGDFVEHCFPSFYMTLTSFSDYLTKYGFERKEDKLKRLFNAFNFTNKGFLSFSEFLIGLASIEPMAKNGQSRIKLVFKYYNKTQNGFLSKHEFEEMVREIHPKDSDQQISEKVSANMKRIGVKKEGIAFDDFFKACGSHKFRGTSTLCRSNRSIITQISRSMATRSVTKSAAHSSKGENVFKALLEERQYKGVCNSCKEKRYDYAIHSVMLNKEGCCVDPIILSEWDSIEHPVKSSENKSSNSSQEINTKSDTTLQSNPSVPKVFSSVNLLNMSFEQFSKDIVFNPEFAANLFLKQIRDFNLRKGSHTDNKGLMDAHNERPQMVSQLEKLCREAERILASEERCVQISSPAFVIGDIHGNLEDLLTLEKVLWKSIPIVSSNYLFLGDYVDRGKWSVECAIYILCLKVLAPTKVYVLRGNHEVRDLQIHYTYKKECIHKYGEEFGHKVFEMTNKVFDKLPVCAVIDDAIYCAHGGIPCSTRLVEQINQINVDLKDPERESAIAWEILWSDPIGAQQYLETAELLQIRIETAKGFLTNTKRGTAYLFGEEAANNFFNSNGLTHIVRAHEVPAEGFQFHFGTKCTTIFSCSHYCGTNNSAACLHVDQQKIRVVRLDTVNNAPACD